MTRIKRALEILINKLTKRIKRSKTKQVKLERKIILREHMPKKTTSLVILGTLVTLRSKVLRPRRDLVTLEMTWTLSRIQRLKIQDLEISMRSKPTNSKSTHRSIRHQRILQPQKCLSQAKKKN
jgi:hypothetical protein